MKKCIWYITLFLFFCTGYAAAGWFSSAIEESVAEKYSLADQQLIISIYRGQNPNSQQENISTSRQDPDEFPKYLELTVLSGYVVKVEKNQMLIMEKFVASSKEEEYQNPTDTTPIRTKQESAAAFEYSTYNPGVYILPNIVEDNLVFVKVAIIDDQRMAFTSQIVAKQGQWVRLITTTQPTQQSSNIITSTNRKHHQGSEVWLKVVANPQ